MSTQTRREFHQQTIGSLLTLSLLETLFQTDAFADGIKPITAKWLADLHQLGLDLKGEKLRQTEWQDKVAELYQQVDLNELLKFTDFAKLTKNLEFRDLGERSLRPTFPAVEGLPTRLVFGHQVFALRKDRSVVPHGHDNMATAFLILQGEFQGRHYDRLEDEPEHVIVKPTIDRQFSVGECSTVSDHKDNVHWFQARSETAFIFNIHVTDVVAGRPSGRVYLDPNGEKLSDGRIRARKLKSAEAYKLYG